MTHHRGASISLAAVDTAMAAASSDLRPFCSMSKFIGRRARSFTLVRVDALRTRALELVDAELDRLRALGPAAVRELSGPPRDARQGELTVSTRVESEDDRLMVLVEAWRGRRTLATGGFAMRPDGSTHTPH